MRECQDNEIPQTLTPTLGAFENFTLDLQFNRLTYTAYGKDHQKKLKLFLEFPIMKEAIKNWWAAGPARDQNFPHIPLGDVIAPETLVEITNSMTSQWMGYLRKLGGNPLSSFLDAMNTFHIMICILGGMSNALWIWHKEGLCLKVLKGLFTPLYNYIFFPVRVGLMGIENYRWEDEENDVQPENEAVAVVEEVPLTVLGEDQEEG